MRTLTSTLAAAQKQASSRPYVRAVFSDQHGAVSRLRFNRLYDGSEGEYYSAATCPADGSLVRARIDPATKVLYTQRVASPGPGSDFSQWASHGTVSASGAVALAASGTSVFLFYVDADTLTLKQKQSTDSGASFGSATTVATAASAVTYLAAAIAPGGDRALFWTVGAVVWKSRFSGSSWGTPAAWTNTVHSLTGIACKYRFDWGLAICGAAQTSQDARVWTAVYGDDGDHPADTWTGLVEVTSATATTNVTFRSPALDFIAHWRLFFVEKYTGSVAYSRLQWTTMNGASAFDLEQWREPAAFDHTGDYGVSAAVSPSKLWLTSAEGVWLASAPSWPSLDVSADVIEAAVDLDEYEGRARLVLRNDPSDSGAAGRYSTFGGADLSAIQRGARLELAAGYYTSDGAEASIGTEYWVESIELETGPQGRLVINARDAWWLLSRWRARRQFVWPAGSKAISQIIRFLCARGGLEHASVSTSDAYTDLEPAFTVHPGEDGRGAIRRLLAMIPDEAIARGSTISVVLPEVTDTSTYAYGAEHAIVSAHYSDLGASVNRVRVLGSAIFDEAFDFAEIEAVGERIGQATDVNLTSAPMTGDRAASELRTSEVRERRDELHVFGVNCGQELYDAVSVTDAQATLVSAKRRVLGLHWRYATATGRYDMTLYLGSP
jgi:hypothetical protein